MNGVLFNLEGLPGIRLHVKTVIASAELRMSRDDVVSVTRETQAQELAQRILQYHKFFSADSEDVLGEQLHTIRAEAIVLTPDEFERAIVEAYKRGLMRRQSEVLG